MQIIIDDSPIYYEQHGEGIPVLCIHGFPEDHRVMQSCLEPIFETLTGYCRIYVDLPGMGKSPANHNIANADDMIDIIQQFIDQVIGNHHFLLIGQSYGGYLSLGLALLSSERIMGIYFLCPCVVSDRSKRRLPRKVITQYQDVTLSSQDKQIDYDDFISMAVVVTDSTWTRYKQEVLPGLKCADTEFTEPYQKNGYSFSFESKFQTIFFEKPASFLMGRQDDCVGYEDTFQLMECFPRASYSIIDGAGHNLQIEQPQRFEDDFLNWLKYYEE